MSATIELNDEDLKNGVLGLVVALVDIIKDTLRLQAMKRMESGKLSEEEIEKLGKALIDLERAIEEIKEEHALRESVKSVRDGLDGAVEEVLDAFILQERAIEEMGLRESGL